MRWDQARVASRRELQKPRKMHAPVGERPDNWEFHESHRSCHRCGYHVCDCQKARDKALLDEIRQHLQKALLAGPWFIA